jgi:hypothetical protein
MQADQLTIGVAVAAGVILGIYDLWTLKRRGYATTISWTALLWARRYPVIPFLVGMVIGHVYWSVQVDGGCP